jgi:hypothetical protein
MEIAGSRNSGIEHPCQQSGKQEKIKSYEISVIIIDALVSRLRYTQILNHNKHTMFSLGKQIQLLNAYVFTS